jgi:hypothetical protein
MNNGPILVTGADRSGTSLLYAILASHRDVSMIRRANLWRWFDHGFGDLSDPINLDRCLDTLIRYRRLDALAIAPEEIKAVFAGGDKTYGRLFRTIFEAYATRNGTIRWGDKSLHEEHHTDRIFQEWPDARVVQLMRDPRDRHASVIRRYPDQRKGLPSITGRWIDSHLAARRNLTVYGDRYRVIRYETLAQEPEKTMRELCDFLELEYEPSMLAMNAVDEQRDQGGNSSFGPQTPGSISTRSIGRYAEILDSTELAFIERLCREGMDEYGYPPSRPQPGAGFWVTEFPVLAARTSLWRLDEARQRRRGHRIPERRLLSDETDPGAG